jgi:hypothetical protein
MAKTKNELIAANKQPKTQITELEASLQEALAQLVAKERASKRQAAPLREGQSRNNHTRNLLEVCWSDHIPVCQNGFQLFNSRF